MWIGPEYDRPTGSATIAPLARSASRLDALSDLGRSFEPERERRMKDLGGSGFGDLDRLLGLVRRTRELLDSVAGDGELPEGGADYLAEATLPHLEGIQEGFRGWLRSEGVGLAELQYLLRLTAAARVAPPDGEAERRAAALERWLEERAAERVPGGVRSGLHNARASDLVGLAHARVVLAFLPHLPDQDVRYPAPRRTYADIPVPRGPAELAERLAELERLLWQAATRRPIASTDPAFRRTYGFFDAADRLGWRAFPAA
jgi:hypothetical protein